MFEAVAWLLIQLALVALVIYVIFWALGEIGVPFPPKLPRIVMVIFGLIALVLLARLLLPGLASGKLGSLSGATQAVAQLDQSSEWTKKWLT